MRADLGTGLGRLLLAQLPQKFIECDSAHIERGRARQQFIEDDSQRVDIGAGVDILTRRIGLLRAHVLRSTQQHSHAREHGIRGQLLGECFGDSEIDNLGRRPAVHINDQDVGWLQIAVDDGFLMCVLHSFADAHEKVQPFAGAEPVIIAVVGDRNAGHVLHDEVRRALGR